MVEGHVAEERGVVDAPIGRSTRTPTVDGGAFSDGRAARTATRSSRASSKPHAMTLLRLPRYRTDPPDPRASRDHWSPRRERSALRPPARQTAARGPVLLALDDVGLRHPRSDEWLRPSVPSAAGPARARALRRSSSRRLRARRDGRCRRAELRDASSSARRTRRTPMSIFVAVACSERGVAPFRPKRSVKTSRCRSVSFSRAP
jgi:hypothetical protein